MSPSCARSVLLGVVALSVPAGRAFAEEEVRIALASGLATVRVAAGALGVFDGDTGVRLGVGRGELALVKGGAGVRVADGKLELDAGKRGDAKRLLFEAADGVRVNGRLYLGRLTVGPVGKGLEVINRLPLETYLLGIVGSEMNPSWPLDALKAQAVSARTYAMQRRMRMRAANKPYDLESTVLSQVYKGAEAVSPHVVQAVKETRGEVMAYAHQLVEALFHSTCGGETVSANAVFGHPVPYLKSRTCTWCTPSSRYRWKTELALSSIEKPLAKRKLIRGRLEKLEAEEGGAVVLRASGGTAKVAASEVRAALGWTTLYSQRFSAKTDGGKVRFSGRGFGHGVGMCQWGARGLAQEGKGYREILSYYFGGAVIRRLY